MTSTSAEQTASIKKSMQDEKAAKDEVIRELARELARSSAALDAMARGYGLSEPIESYVADAKAALRKAGAL